MDLQKLLKPTLLHKISVRPLGVFTQARIILESVYQQLEREMPRDQIDFEWNGHGDPVGTVWLGYDYTDCLTRWCADAHGVYLQPSAPIAYVSLTLTLPATREHIDISTTISDGSGDTNESGCPTQ